MALAKIQMFKQLIIPKNLSNVPKKNIFCTFSVPEQENSIPLRFKLLGHDEIPLGKLVNIIPKRLFNPNLGIELVPIVSLKQGVHYVEKDTAASLANQSLTDKFNKSGKFFSDKPEVYNKELHMWYLL